MKVVHKPKVLVTADIEKKRLHQQHQSRPFFLLIPFLSFFLLVEYARDHESVKMRRGRDQQSPFFPSRSHGGLGLDLFVWSALLAATVFIGQFATSTIEFVIVFIVFFILQFIPFTNV